jgi:MinD superfamily P-loop ATPase
VKELVVVSGKGGTGKTSVLGALASLAENAVLADCDVDAANLHVLLKPEVLNHFDFIGGKIACIDPDKCTSCGVCEQVCRFNAITPEYKVDEIACEGCGVCVWNCPENAISFNEHKNGEWFVSTTRFGDMVHAKLGIAEENSGKLVTLVRNEAKKLAGEKNNDLLLVDGPPGTGCPVIAAIGGANAILIVVEPTLSAIHDMQRVIKLARHFGVPATVAINKSDLNNKLTAEIESFCKNENLPIVGHIPYDLDIVRAQMNGQTIMEFDNNMLKKQFSELWNTLQQYLNNN